MRKPYFIQVASVCTETDGEKKNPHRAKWFLLRTNILESLLQIQKSPWSMFSNDTTMGTCGNIWRCRQASRNASLCLPLWRLHSPISPLLSASGSVWCELSPAYAGTWSVLYTPIKNMYIIAEYGFHTIQVQFGF